jgi:hypothetical protein
VNDAEAIAPVARWRSPGSNDAGGFRVRHVAMAYARAGTLRFVVPIAPARNANPIAPASRVFTRPSISN